MNINTKTLNENLWYEKFVIEVFWDCKVIDKEQYTKAKEAIRYLMEINSIPAEGNISSTVRVTSRYEI